MQDIKLDIKDQDPNFSKLIEKIGSIKLEQNNIIQTLHSIMESVEILDKNIKGSSKKDLAIKSIKWLANNQVNLLDVDKLLLNTLIDQIVPATIDVIIDISNGLSNLVKTKCPCF
jgi:hypothetical protein